MNQWSKLVVSAVVAGFLSSQVAIADDSHPAGGEEGVKAEKGKDGCKGKNGCKGKKHKKSKNACKGKNGCHEKDAEAPAPAPEN